MPICIRRKTPHSQLVDKKFNSFSCKGFCEDVRQLILRIDKHKAIALLYHRYIGILLESKSHSPLFCLLDDPNLQDLSNQMLYDTARCVTSACILTSSMIESANAVLMQQGKNP
ncbi:hypothetical protein Tco_0014757 [Tanacetum coccineum]